MNNNSGVWNQLALWREAIKKSLNSLNSKVHIEILILGFIKGLFCIYGRTLKQDCLLQYQYLQSPTSVCLYHHHHHLHPHHHPYNHPQQTSFTTILISSGYIKSFGMIKDYIVRIWHWLSKNVIGFEIEGLFWDYNVVNWRFTYSQVKTLWYRNCSKRKVRQFNEPIPVRDLWTTNMSVVY